MVGIGMVWYRYGMVVLSQNPALLEIRARATKMGPGHGTGAAHVPLFPPNFH